MIDFKSTFTEDNIAVVNVLGKLEDFACPYFFGCMEDLLQDGHREIVIDCQGIAMITAGCLRSLFKARRLANKQGGQIVLANVNDSILELIGLPSLKKLFGIYPSLDAALIKTRRNLRRKSGEASLLSLSN